MRDALHLVSQKGNIMRRISEVSALAGISKRTLQYYDELGLLPAERFNKKDRIYTEKSIQTLIRILIYKSDGLKLQEIKKIIELSDTEQLEYLCKHIDKLQYENEKINENMRFTNYILEEGLSNIEAKIKSNDDSTLSQQIENIKSDLLANKIIK